MTIPAKSGVYQILCTANEKIYIGSAKNLSERWHNHKSQLTHGVHHNKMLQRAWVKYGADAFLFSVLELCPVSKLVEREQYWIDVTDCCDRTKGYNILKKARSALGMKMPQEVIEKQRNRFSKVWEGFIDPDGNDIGPITNLRTFCLERGLSPSAMQQLAHGHPNFKSHKGWTHKISPPRRQRSAPPQVDNSKVWDGFIDPKGNRVEPITNLERFCKERGLITANMRAVAYGKRQSHKGWTHINAAPYKTKPHKGRY